MTTRWKPEYANRYWYITVDEIDADVSPTIWTDETIDRRLYGYGNCFKTREQAEEALEKIKQVLLEAHDE